MRITVNRFLTTSKATLGEVRVDGKYICYSLEDTARDTKVAGETRIKQGLYKITVRKYGKFYSALKKYTWAKGVLELKDVPNFSDILIHSGNTIEDTRGCLLVGLKYKVTGEDIVVLDSLKALEKLYTIVMDAALANKLDILYIDLTK